MPRTQKVKDKTLNKEHMISKAEEVKTVREVAEEWLLSKKDSVAMTSYCRYEDALNRTVLPKCGDLPISDVTQQVIDEFTNSITEKMKKKSGMVSLSALQMSSGILSSLVDFYHGTGETVSLNSRADKRNSFKALTGDELKRICIAVKNHVCLDMIAVLLTLFCGIRLGEICALDWEDVNFDARKIYVHKSAHRVSVDGDALNKSELIIAEIPTKTHIRMVDVPDEILDYMRQFKKRSGIVLTGFPGLPMETRTLQNRVKRVFDIYKMGYINFQCLRKTYVEGKADTGVLREILAPEMPGRAADTAIDKVWLSEEMVNDLQPLRLLLGLSAKETADILGVSESVYYGIESGRREISWSEYLALLFFFRFNRKTAPVVECLGLYPEALKNKLTIM